MSQQENTYVVTIPTRRRIPFINVTGPVTFPVNIRQRVYDELVSLGFPVNVHKVITAQEVLDAELASKKYQPEIAKDSEVDTNNAPEFAKLPTGKEPTPEFQDTVVKAVEVEEQEVVKAVAEEANDSDAIAEEEAQAEDIRSLVKTQEEIESMDTSALRDYILQFQDYLTESEVNTANKAQQRRLLALALSITNDILEGKASKQR